MTVHIGRVGALTLLNSVGRGFTADLDIPSVLHEIAGSRGGRVVQRMGAEKRTFTASKNHLSADDLGVLEGYALGAYGPGPYVLLDSARRNLLTANQSSGTDALDDTTGFVAITGALSSSTAQSDHGSRSLAWAVTAINQRMMLGDLANTTNATPTLDTPVLPSTVYSVGNRCRLLGSSGTVRVDAYWFDAAGAFISASTGTATALATGSFTTCPCLNITSPSTAALMRASMINTAFGVATTIYSDKWQVSYGATLPAWTLGTGVPRVSFIDKIAQSYLAQPYVDTAVTLVEV